MKRFGLILFLCFTLFQAEVYSQLAEPVKWSQSIKELPNGEALLIFEASVQPKWHLYSQFFPEGGPIRLSFNFETSKNYKRIGKVVETPAPKKEHDDVFGIDVQYYTGKATFTQKIKILTDKDFSVKVELEGQACSDEDGSCVPLDPSFEIKVKGVPQSGVTDNSKQDSIAKDTVKLADNKGNDTLKVVETANFSDSTLTTPVSNVNSDINLSNGSLIWLFWISFIAGLLAILTPCVFPMIPMTVSFFMKRSDTRKKGRFQAIFYGLSIVLIYTVIGTLVAVIFGVNFANWLSTHWLPNVLFFLIFMFFAASFLGMFEITLPSWMINKSDEKVDKGGFWAPFFMAFTLVLVSFSCTGPLVGAILVKSAGGAVLEPIVGMLGFSLAFALPFTLFAFFPSWLNNLPKSGGWLNSVKVVLGFIEIALGFKFLSVADQTYHWGILDREIYIAIWVVLAILLGVYFLGKIKFSHDNDSEYVSVPRFGLALLSFTFAVYLLPGMIGAPLKALSGYLPPLSSHDFDISALIRDNQSDQQDLPEKPKYGELLHLPHGIKGYFEYDQALRVSKKIIKPIFIDFTGHGCVNCREMEANVWSDPRVLKILKNDYLVTALYVDDKTDLPENEWITSTFDGKVKKTIGKKNADFQISRFHVNAQPYYVLLDTNGELMVMPRAYNLNVEAFIDFLEAGKSEFAKRQKK